jgi:hypothetical protein
MISDCGHELNSSTVLGLFLRATQQNRTSTPLKTNQVVLLFIRSYQSLLVMFEAKHAYSIIILFFIIPYDINYKLFFGLTDLKIALYGHIYVKQS